MRDAERNALSQSAMGSLRGYLQQDSYQVVKTVGKANPRPQDGDLAAQKVILVVDDDSLVRGVIRRALTRQGHSILEAGTGKEALAICSERDGQIDLLVTDLVMPEMSGFELASAVKARYPGVPMLYVSGYAEEAVVSGRLAQLRATFLRKPFTLDELAGKVKEMLGL